MSRLHSKVALGLLAFGLSGQSVLAHSQHEAALRATLSPIVESAASREAEAPTPTPTALDSGLKLHITADSDPLPEKLSYSLDVSPQTRPGKVSNENAGALPPGLYDLAIQEDGREVFRKQILAINALLSGLEITYSRTKGYSLRQTIELPQLKFAPGQRKLVKPSFALLKDMIALLKREESIEVFAIEVHTDSNGDAEMNQELTQARAIEVRNYLVKNGIDAQRIRAAGFGSERPVASNDTKEGRLQNRRLEYIIQETSDQPKLLGDR